MADSASAASRTAFRYGYVRLLDDYLPQPNVLDSLGGHGRGNTWGNRTGRNRPKHGRGGIGPDPASRAGNTD